MRVTYNWLKDFVDIKISAQRLAERLTMAGLEVTSLEKKNDDFVFEFEITSNRPDLLSVIGIAREVAAITGKKLKFPALSKGLQARSHKHRNHRQPNGQLSINIENTKDCPFYTARIIKGINVRSSPDWLKRRLELVGVRSVNNIVDIANYVLLETGQPLHAFDLGRLKGNTIFVRRARGSEGIITIDEEKHSLSREILVIADRDKPIAIAGIMGSKHCEVNNNTSDILLEAAVFDPIVTRRASRELGLSSESSYRFERGIDWQNVDVASLRAADLILNLAGGRLILSKGTTKPRTKEKIIILKTEEVNRILGRDYVSREIEKILAILCFSVRKSQGKALKISIPSFRIDVNQPVDLIEEVARISSYENIPIRLPKIIPQIETSTEWKERKVVRDILLSQGANEVITYSLISKGLVSQFGYSDSQLITITNPLTSEQEILRPSIIPNLISCVGYNLNQRQEDICLFEIGNIFPANQEQPSLGLVYSIKKFNPLHLKGVLELLLARLGIDNFEFLKNHSEPAIFKKDESSSLMVNNKTLANLGMIKPGILERLDIKACIVAAELDLGMLFIEMRKIQKRYAALPLYPEVLRDISVIIKQDILIGDVMKKIMKNKIPYLVKLDLKGDPYHGKQIPSGYKGLTLSCIYRSDDHTLTTQEIDTAHQKVSGILRTEFSAQQR